MADKIHEDIKHYMRILEDYRWCMKEVYEARVEMEDIAIQFQPVKGIQTDKQLLENSKPQSDQFILEKIYREEQAIKKQERAMLVIDDANDIIKYVIDTLEKDMITDYYMKDGFTKYDFSVKYSYEKTSIYNKMYWIIKKAIGRKNKLN